MSSSKTQIPKSNDSQINWPNVFVFLILHFLASYALIKCQLTIPLLILSVIFYSSTIFSLTAGYHRLFAHKSYEAILPFKLFVLVMGSSGFLGSALSWSSYHRAHHRFVDTWKDPMSIKRGVLHAHIGWRWNQATPVNREVDVKDLEKDPWIRYQHTYYVVVALLSGVLLPALAAHYLLDDFVLLSTIDSTVRVDYCMLGSLESFWCSVCHLVGFQQYSDQNSSRNVGFVSWLTFGEGYQNFHHQFPNDYRLGVRFREFDPNKWIILILSYIGVTSHLSATNKNEVMKTRLEMKQRKLDRIKTTLDFGPDITALPEVTWAQITEKVKGGAKWVVVDGLVHDVADFIRKHPGGIKILQARIGRDATIAFNGALYCHTKAARNLAAMFRVARLVKHEINLRTQSDFEALQIDKE